MPYPQKYSLKKIRVALWVDDWDFGFENSQTIYLYSPGDWWHISDITTAVLHYRIIWYTHPYTHTEPNTDNFCHLSTTSLRQALCLLLTISFPLCGAVHCSASMYPVLLIRDQMPFWPLDPRWVKIQDPGGTTRIIFPWARKIFWG
jgi:hypothetical protein